MKLTICYTTFNGLELLEKSISNIYDLVDCIIICHQKISNTGNLEKEPRLNHRILKMLADEYPKVRLLNFEPNLSLNTKENERNKHNRMITFSRFFGTTHFVLSACDHFYKKNEFEYVKQKCLVNDYDVTFTKMYTYYKHINWQISPIEDYYMPFIMKLHLNTEISTCKYPLQVDPSVKINTCNNFHVFEQNEIMLHHYSMIREDIVDKFTNAAASIRWTPQQIFNFIDEYENAKVGDEISYFRGRKIIEVPVIEDFNLI